MRTSFVIYKSFQHLLHVYTFVRKTVMEFGTNKQLIKRRFKMETYDLTEFNYPEYLEKRIDSINGKISIEIVDSIIIEKKEHLQSYINRIEKTYKKVNDYLAHACMFKELGDEKKAEHQTGKYEKELKSLNELKKTESNFHIIQDELKYYLNKREELIKENDLL